jgi:N-acetyl-anhydromuramyl-L-alanine amidase AmpD
MGKIICDRCKREIENGLMIKSSLGTQVIDAGNARARGTNKNIDKIVLHSQGVPDNFGDTKALSSIVNWFTSKRDSGRSSAHYFVNFNGDIHLLVPEDAVAWHAGTLGNKNSIGIEVAGSTNRLKFTAAQEEAIRKLVANIKSRHNIKRVYTHADFGKPGCPFYDGSKNPFIKELNA